MTASLKVHCIEDASSVKKDANCLPGIGQKEENEYMLVGGVVKRHRPVIPALAGIQNMLK